MYLFSIHSLHYGIRVFLNFLLANIAALIKLRNFMESNSNIMAKLLPIKKGYFLFMKMTFEYI